MVAVTRQECQRLRRDLHDGLGPSLSGVGLGLQALQDAQLTTREREVLELVVLATVTMNRPAAGPTEKTVRNHVAAILLKLEVADRAAAVAKAATLASAAAQVTRCHPSRGCAPRSGATSARRWSPSPAAAQRHSRAQLLGGRRAARLPSGGRGTQPGAAWATSRPVR